LNLGFAVNLDYDVKFSEWWSIFFSAFYDFCVYNFIQYSYCDEAYLYFIIHIT